MAPLPPLPQQTIDAIYQSYMDKELSRQQWRAHLGASVLGRECPRALWYGFRWCLAPVFNGRILRLFETGHQQEARLIRDLRATGATVVELDPETGKQWTVSAESGHVGGSLDAIAYGVVEAPATPHVVECKTHNQKNFNKLIKHGVAKAFPVHFAQMQIYMYLTNLTRALYLAVCKNDESLYQERVVVDTQAAETLLKKGDIVVTANLPLPKISQDPEYFVCKMCDFRPICHEKAWSLRNCRTCLHSKVKPKGQWHCAKHNVELSKKAQEKGCEGHRYLTELVPGEQVDVDGEDVIYSINDEQFVDNGT